jgi:hypothetical protein
MLLQEFTDLRFKIAKTKGLGKKKFIILACLNLIIEVLADNKISANFSLDALNQTYWDNFG